MSSSKLRQALERGIQPGGELAEELYALGDYPISTDDDARAVVEALRGLSIPVPPAEVERVLSPLLWLFHEADTEEAVTVFGEDGLPLVTQHFDALVGTAESDERAEALSSILKLLATYRDEGLVERIAVVAQSRLAVESAAWSEIFACLEDDHPLWPDVVEVLRDPLPEGQLAAAYLDLANSRSLDGELADHPFNTPSGKAMLLDWLQCTDDEECGFAESASAAIPYISDPERTQLLALAMDHPDEKVQREGAWASARLGSEGGVKILSRLCLDVRHCAVASEYLRELEREDAIPPEAHAPEHVAKGELSRWLEHPSEFGLPPDEIEVMDTREIYWPPTDDLRQMWILRFTYHADQDDDTVQTGVGVVGSMTFSLAIDALEERPVEDIYGLHCCLELQCLQDERAPEELDAKLGWQLICGR